MLHNLYVSILSNTRQPAFYIGGIAYSYLDLNTKIATIQHSILPQPGNESRLGIVTNDDIETYSGIIACLLAGITFVPLEPAHPSERNNSIIEQAGLKYILCSSNELLSFDFLEKHQQKLIPCSPTDSVCKDVVFQSGREEDVAYILFTSGTTGFPKGVPISRKNLNCFLGNALVRFGPVRTEDKFLQLFDLTFDLSLYSYLVPLIAGACVYTLPKKSIKYTAAISLLQEYDITYILSVPSFVGFLKPYFKQINLPSIKVWLFCGEALQQDLVVDWQKCIPEARIWNVYGPTEATIFCTEYLCSNSDSLSSYNGIVSIGKPFRETEFVILDEDQSRVLSGITGELYISGAQVTQGYIENENQNYSSFISMVSGEENKIFYKSGDLAFQDKEGNYYFVGRKDSQVKIQGFRVELGEIENHALTYEGVDDAVALVKSNNTGVMVMHLFVKPENVNIAELSDHLKKRLPEYMLPKDICSIDTFPLNLNGKTDRNALSELLA